VNNLGEQLGGLLRLWVRIHDQGLAVNVSYCW